MARLCWITIPGNDGAPSPSSVNHRSKWPMFSPAGCCPRLHNMNEEQVWISSRNKPFKVFFSTFTRFTLLERELKKYKYQHIQYIYIHAWVWFHKGLADYPKKNTCSSPKSRSQPCHLSSCIQSLVHAGLEGLVPGALRGQRKQPGWGKDFLLTGAFYVGNFREWSISSLSIIMPATPSNPSIPYI